MGKSSQDSGSSSEASDSSASCELGKQEFWEKTYAKEIANFEDTGDTGEIW